MILPSCYRVKRVPLEQLANLRLNMNPGNIIDKLNDSNDVIVCLEESRYSFSELPDSCCWRILGYHRPYNTMRLSVMRELIARRFAVPVNKSDFNGRYRDPGAGA